MAIVLITGMSGTGKSTTLVELASRGHATVDTDEGGWIEEVWLAEESTMERLWIEERMTALLDRHTDGHLFLQGTVRNQGRFYSRFDAIVLLSAPLEIMLDRVARRDNNPYGRSDEERSMIVEHWATVEPLLRTGATHEFNTEMPVSDIADRLEAIADRVSR